MEREQEKLNDHVKNCEKCRAARGMHECCQIGRVLARIVESKVTR